jgi:hypothetical protein
MMTAKHVRGAAAATTVMLMLFGGGVVSIGCDKKSEPAKTNVPKPPTPDVTPKASMGTSANSGSSPAKAPTVAATTTQPATITKAPTTTSSASVGQPVPSAQNSRDADKLIAKAIEAIKENHFDDARQMLNELDGMKDSLQPQQAKMLATVHASLDSIDKQKSAPPPAAVDPDNK